MESKKVKFIAHRPTPSEVMLHRAKLGMMGISPGIEPIYNPFFIRRNKNK